MPKKNENGINQDSLKLLRESLGSINLRDQFLTDADPQGEQKRKDYCASISAVFPKLEKTLKEMMADQILFAVNKTESWEQVLFSRGTFNGLMLLMEHIKLANDEHLNANEKDFNQFNPLPEV